MPLLKNLTGHKFGLLTVVSRATDWVPKKNPRFRKARWLCQCECGKFKIVRAGNLLNGGSSSCGHVSAAKARARLMGNTLTTKHGLSGSIEYNTWEHMKDRCYNENCEHYRHYGGRGISVCARWRDSFEDFLDDVGPRPNLHCTLDRINNNGNYEPGNCRWATKREQALNTRRAVNVLLNGELIPSEVAAVTLGLHRSTLSAKLRRHPNLIYQDARNWAPKPRK